MAYQWYEKLDMSRDNDAEFVLWDDFLGTFVDSFFHQELMEVKTEEFANLKQDRILVKEYALKFH